MLFSSFVFFVRNSLEKFEYLTDEEKRAKMIEIINHEEGIAMAVETLSNITQYDVEYARMAGKKSLNFLLKVLQ